MSEGMGHSREFDALGRILAENGEQSLALAQFYGWPESRVKRLMDKRFGSLTESDRDALQTLASAITESGRQLTEQLRSGVEPSVEIPVNPFLFGDEPAGERVRYIIEIESDDGEPVIRIYLDYPDIPHPADLIEDALEHGRDIIGRYPEKFGLSETEIEALNTVTIIGTVKRF